MTLETLTTFINNTGFPIVCCVGMFYLYNRTIKVLNEMNTAIDKMSDSLNELTKSVIEKERNFKNDDK